MFSFPDLISHCARIFFTQAATEKSDALKRNIGQLAADVELDAERTPRSRLSGQQTIMGSFMVSSSSALPSAIAGFIHCHGLSFELFRSPLLAEIIRRAKSAPSSCSAPNREDIAGVFLE